MPQESATSVAFGGPDVCILGEFRVNGVDGTIWRRSPKRARLLGLLLMNVNRTVSSADLARLVWPHTLPASPGPRRVATAIYRLRSIISAAGVTTIDIETVGAGYRAVGDPDSIDLHARLKMLKHRRLNRDPGDLADLIDEAASLFPEQILKDLVTEEMRPFVTDGLFALLDDTFGGHIHESAIDHIADRALGRISADAAAV
ncbi:AfsR/SARP family transcriptional regulator [Amycolatopsis antarctica]|uniref:AfsR/SARP family transcriptional regulator n=1 Tax=Amycolatopsis antarctica TaxID=1854586 RepID=UPI0013FD7AC7|nr:winged helix-turn-helix domain-containing protein [Amycolatopsis antarctica]